MAGKNTIQNNNAENKTKEYKLLATGVIVALIISIIALVLSIMSVTGIIDNGTWQGINKKVVISKQYDRGKNLEKALNTKKNVVVFFYTDWCGYCQRFAPTYNKISKNSKLKSLYSVAYVNCEKFENIKLMQEYQIEQYPTVYVITKNNKKIAIKNSLLFADDAKTSLVDKLLEIAKENE